MSTLKIKAVEARRIALFAQGFGRSIKGQTDWRRIKHAVATMGVLQIDSVNVLIRSHYLPVFARIGSYDRTALDRKSLEPKGRALFEYWGHEASFLPLDAEPLFRWRKARAAKGIGLYKGLVTFADERSSYIQRVRDEIKDRGPLTARALDEAGARKGPWWGWRDGKTALEYLFWTGEVTTSARQNFERIYDLPERVLPGTILNLATPCEAEAQRRLLKIAARALGIATAADLKDYFRLPTAVIKPRMAELVENGDLLPAEVEGWDQPAFLDPGARRRKPIEASALLSPFDPLIWSRPRTERLFGMRHRLEFYVPKEKRRFGYYVLPFLHRDRLVGKVDLKAERSKSRLDVLGAFAEPMIDPDDDVPVLLARLKAMAAWLGLDHLHIHANGDLAAALQLAAKGG